MAIYPTYAHIGNGSDLKQAFSEMGRDEGNLPIAYYDALFEIVEQFSSDDTPYELDIIALDCDITYTTLEDKYITPDMYSFGDEPNTGELAEYLLNHTTVIWYDETTVYRFAY